MCAGVVDNDLLSRPCLPMTAAYVIMSGRSSLQSMGLVLSIAMVMYTTIATYRVYLHDVPTSLLVTLEFLPTLLLYRSICLGAFNFAGSFTVSLVLLLTCIIAGSTCSVTVYVTIVVVFLCFVVYTLAIKVYV